MPAGTKPELDPIESSEVKHVEAVVEEAEEEEQEDSSYFGALVPFGELVRSLNTVAYS